MCFPELERVFKKQLWVIIRLGICLLLFVVSIALAISTIYLGRRGAALQNEITTMSALADELDLTSQALDIKLGTAIEQAEATSDQLDKTGAELERAYLQLETIKERRDEQIKTSVAEAQREFFWFGMWRYCTNVQLVLFRTDGRASCLKEAKRENQNNIPQDFNTDGWDWNYVSGREALQGG